MLNAGGGGIPAEFARLLRRRRRANAGLGQNITPNADAACTLSPLDRRGRGGATPASGRSRSTRRREFRQMARQFGIGVRRRRAPRVVMQFPPNPNDMLLSGTLADGQALAEPRGSWSTRRSARATS